MLILLLCKGKVVFIKSDNTSQVIEKESSKKFGGMTMTTEKCKRGATELDEFEVTEIDKDVVTLDIEVDIEEVEDTNDGIHLYSSAIHYIAVSFGESFTVNDRKNMVAVNNSESYDDFKVFICANYHFILTDLFIKLFTASNVAEIRIQPKTDVEILILDHGRSFNICKNKPTVIYFLDWKLQTLVNSRISFQR